MIKKTMLSSLIFVCASSTIYAKSSSYVGGGLGVGGYSQVSGINGANVNLFAGKGRFLDKEEKLYIGGELGANFHYHPSQTNTFGLDVSILPGLMVTESTMLYARLGIAGDYGPKEFISFGTVLGVGVQTKVAKNWDVRTEYTSFAGGNRGSELGLGLVYKFD